MKDEEKTAWLFVLIVCALAAAVAFLCLGCVKESGKLVDAREAARGASGTPINEAGRVQIGWDSETLKGAKVADKLEVGDKLGWEAVKKQTEQADIIEEGATKTESGADVLQGGSTKQAYELTSSLVNVRLEIPSAVNLGVLIFCIVGMCILWSALRITVSSIGKAEAVEAATHVKTETHVSPILSPIRWLGGKIIDLVAWATRSKLRAA